MYNARFDIRFEGLAGPLKRPGHYDAICLRAQYSTSLHFTPPKPHIKNISKIYMWINLWITIKYMYQTRLNQTFNPVDNLLL